MPDIKLNNGYIAGQLAKYLGPFIQDGGVLVKVTPGARGAVLTGGTNPTETRHACKLLVKRFEDNEINGTSIQSSDRRISILRLSIEGGVTPAPNDKIEADGATYRIVDDGVSGGIDAPFYRCHCRA